MNRRIALLILLVLAAAGITYAQAVKASLVGTITDSSGAVVPGARVTITEINTGFTRSMETNESGYYVFGNLDPGSYRVEVEQTGFKKAVRDRVDVIVNTTVRVDLQLQPGQITETIEVIATLPLLQTDRSDVGRKFETRQLQDLPLPMNRNFQGLLRIMPGVVGVERPHSEFFNPQDSMRARVHGQSGYSNNVQLEGIDNNHRTGLLTALIPPIEAIQTVDITTSNYDAELGRAGGAVINVTFRSGTNDFHGSLYEFNRVSRLAARNVFATTKAPTVYNQYGGTLGGPIRRNKTFFFTDYQGTRDRRGDVTRATIPTMDFRRGDLSLSTTTIYDPLTGRPDGTARLPFSDKQIPESRISPIARKILSFIPPPTFSGFSTNYERATVRQKDTHSADVKIDHQFRESDTLMYRYSVQRSRIFDPGLYEMYGGPKAGGFAGEGKQLSQNTALNYTHIFSARTITELRLGVMRYRNDALNQDSGRKTAEEIGIRGVNLDRWTSGLTSINIDGYSNPIVGFAASLPWIRSETNFNFVSNWTKIVSNHTLKAGADIRRNRDDLLQTQTYNPRGLFIFRAGPTALNGDPRTSFANSFAAFLLDVPNEFGRDLAGIFPTFRQTQIFGYFQDKWQVTSRLTVDLGLRYELYLPPTTVHRAGFSNYNPENNSLELAGVGSIPWNLGLRTDSRNFAPRFGLAYRLTPGTVIRGGYGITIDPTYPDDKWAFAFPVKQNNAFFAQNSFVAAGSMAAGFPPPIVAEIPANGIISPAPAGNYLHLRKDLRQGYLQAWNITIQRALPYKFALEAGYVGNHALGVLINRNINAGMIPGAGAAGQPLNQKFGRKETTNVWTPFGSHYQSLQVKLDRRFSEGLVLTNAYTYGKAINLADDNGGLFIHLEPVMNRGRSSHDRTHVFVSGFVYELPFGRGKRWGHTGAVRWLLGDWQISGTLMSMTGLPLSLTYSAATLNAPGNGNRPNVSGKPEIYGQVGRGVKWLNVAKFSAPPPNTFGNVGRNILTGPGMVNLDFAAFRKFRIIGDRLGAELRMESFNFTNTPHFNNPVGDFGSASFGEVTGALADQRNFQFALKLVF
jgi:hypothetical protein